VKTRIGGTDGSGSPSWVRLAILFLTVFVDLVGFGIVLPLLPLYADRFGASGIWIGVLVLSYSAAQLVFAPIWGRLSDRFGRRPILIVGLLGSAASYLVFAYAGSILVLLLSRILAGVGGANIPVAQAYIADVTPPERRAGNMGLIGAAFGLGFIFGPAIGGLLAPIAPELPGLAAAGLCAVNATLAVFFLPESLSPERRSALSDARAGRDPRGKGVRRVPVPRFHELRAFLADPALRTILILSFLFTVAFSVMHPTFPLLASRRFGLDERSVGWLFAFMGVVSALVQGGLVRVLVPRIGEAALVRASAPPFVLGLLLIALAPGVPTLMIGMGLLALGFGGSLPSLVSLLSRAAPEDVQGGSLGIGMSVGAMARILGPLLAGVLWDVMGMGWPYLVAAGIALLAGVGSLKLRQPPKFGVVEAPGEPMERTFLT